MVILCLHLYFCILGIKGYRYAFLTLIFVLFTLDILISAHCKHVECPLKSAGPTVYPHAASTASTSSIRCLRALSIFHCFLPGANPSYQRPYPP